MATNFEPIPKSTLDNSSASKSTQSSRRPGTEENSEPATRSSEWSEHEHVTAQSQLEAEKLVDMVGTPELAKHAIGAVEPKRQPSESGSESTASMAKSRQASSQLSTAFLKSLTDLETSLATPVVSGELIEWVTNALRACEKVRSYLLGDIEKIHADLFSTILKEDVDLSSQVEKLRVTDSQISHADCDKVISSLKEIQNQARSVRQDEAKLDGAMADVISQAMAFVVAARGQETAISAWLSEAFNRDLGSGD